jgi:hypothetical protein
MVGGQASGHRSGTVGRADARRLRQEDRCLIEWAGAAGAGHDWWRRGRKRQPVRLPLAAFQIADDMDVTGDARRYW